MKVETAQHSQFSGRFVGCVLTGEQLERLDVIEIVYVYYMQCNQQMKFSSTLSTSPRTTSLGRRGSLNMIQAE